MEFSPSIYINTKVQETLVVDPSITPPQINTFESPIRFTVLGNVDEAETEPLNSLRLTRNERDRKLLIKYQNLTM